MKTIVTGGTGFLGRAVVESLEYLGASPVALGRSDGDLKDLATARRLVADADLVIHLAATVGGVGFLKSNKTSAYYENLTLGFNVIEACRSGDVRRLVLIGTPCSYPAESPLPLQEGAIFDGLPVGDTGPYGLAKASVSHLANHLLLPCGKDVATFIPANLYGPRDNFEPARSHVVASLVRKAVVNSRQGTGYFEVWGDGSATRDFLHVDDAAETIAQAVLSETPFHGETFNLASGEETSMKVLSEIIAEAVDPAMTVVFDPEKPCGVTRRMMSIDKARVRLGFRPRIALSDGIRDTVRWIERTDVWKSWLPARVRKAA
ncbi:MAG: NAD-dependent epimerase/dehydratase family protein [Planctomycetia bacterium]|nr:NAD-dependent epimerase/dehydratase family protein [Planctomycetia bacterium]